jgi:anti-sigma regulatory factor (Ser/Thr protein kinase)
MTEVLERSTYRHEALIYAGEDEFVDKTARFLRSGVEAGEPALVVVSARKISRLRESLGDLAEAVMFADMADVGLNPARIIPAWRQFVAAHSDEDVRLRGIGEPIYPERTADELIECQRHEALLNLAFQDTPGFWLLCPYDAEAMPTEVIDEAKRTHPYVMNGDQRPSDSFYGLETIREPFAAPLPSPPAHATESRFDATSLAALRAVVRQQADAVGFGETQRDEFVLAVSELAANSVLHGGGTGTARIWQDGDRLICDVVDSGRLTDPMAGRIQPPPGQLGGHGLWLVTQLCDLVQIRPFSNGTTVRVHLARR